VKNFPALAWTLVLALLCVLTCNAAQAGNCHGDTSVKQSVRVGTTVQADESVTIPADEAVTVNESVVVEAPGTVRVQERVSAPNVTVNEQVIVGGPGGAACVGGDCPPVGVHTARKDARIVKRATVAEAKNGRKAGRFARKSYNAQHEAMNDAAVKRIYSSN